MKSICNPLNIRYLYQHIIENGHASVGRESADASIRLIGDTYYLFASMSRGFFYSDDLVRWEYKAAPELPAYDYAPDVCVIDDYVYVCASSAKKNAFYRTKDPLNQPFEEVKTDLVFWDPNLFQDDDGRVYFYWGCSDRTPIWGVELDRKTMKPLCEKIALLEGRPDEHGWERCAENNDLRLQVKHPLFTGDPFIEGAWMTKHNGVYYLQYAGPGTEFNVYADGVYVSDSPLGPFTYAPHNPPSSKPGGFITGAGHGSTFCDKYGNWWHAATMRISVNHMFERRIGIFPAEFDDDGLFCVNQNFADYPMRIPECKTNIWNGIFPGWMLLSYRKHAEASSAAPNCGPENAVNEDIRSCWAAADTRGGQFLCVDLGKVYHVNAIQLNLGDQKIPPVESLKEKEWIGEGYSKRLIDTDSDAAEYTVEISNDGQTWHILKDTCGSPEDHTHEYIVFEKPVTARFVRTTGYTMPYNAPFTVSGLRVFGKGEGVLPAKVHATANMTGPMDAHIRWTPSNGTNGYNVRYGISKDKLYSSWLLYGQTELNLGTLSKGQKYFVCVDAFNENGITEGDITEVVNQADTV
ncbi:endo-1,4-beta-xylanase [Spirochaetia bacterium]|nr:endo-1,4-beta-xylanase [Spirochaetia bacterium]